VARRGLLVLGQTSSFWAAEQSGSFWLDALHPFGQTWSLAIEWYFYLLWPLVVLGARARGLTAHRLALASAGAAVVVYALSLPLGDFWFYFGPTARFAEILAGAALALWLQAAGPSARPLRRAGAASAAGLVAIVVITLLAPAADSPFYRWVEVPVTVLATLVLVHSGHTRPDGPVHRLLSHPWPAAVGRYSYSLYLWHLVPMLLLEDAATAVPKPVLGLLAVTAAVALTVASHHLLERPFLRSRSSELSRGRPVVAAR
jgi:peptidoglycan/LPS O-acetylase OafA/YrhL